MNIMNPKVDEFLRELLGYFDSIRRQTKKRAKQST